MDVMKSSTITSISEFTFEQDIAMLVVSGEQTNVRLKKTSGGNLIKTRSPENFFIWKFISKVYKVLSLAMSE